MLLQAHYRKVSALEALGKKKRALDLCEQCATRFPELPEFRTTLTQLRAAVASDKAKRNKQSQSSSLMAPAKQSGDQKQGQGSASSASDDRPFGPSPAATPLPADSDQAAAGSDDDEAERGHSKDRDDEMTQDETTSEKPVRRFRCLQRFVGHCNVQTDIKANS